MSTTKEKKKIVSSFFYQDPTGKEVYQVVRFEPKEFRVCHRNSKGGLVWKAPDCNYPYRLPEVLAADDRVHVFVVEGEKDVETLREFGLVATTNRGGCGNTKSWAAWGSFFAGKNVVILPDNDAPGKKHAAEVEAYLKSKAKSVVVFELPGLKDKQDVSDWLRKKGNTAVLLVQLVNDRIEKDAWEEVPLPAELPAEPPKGDAWEPARPAAHEDEDLAEGWTPFPIDAMPPILSKYAAAAANALPCDPSLIAIQSLVACAGAVGNSRICEIKRTWTEPCFLWGVAVADPSAKKTACYRLVKWPMEVFDAELVEEGREMLDAYEAELEAWDQQNRGKRGTDDATAGPRRPKRPEVRRLLISDITMESAIRELQRSPRGLVLLRDELSGWFSAFGRYTSSGTSNADQSFWNESYNGGVYRYDRKTGDGLSVIIPRCSVSVYGTIQPEAIQRIFTRAFFESGFAYRFLMCAPPSLPSYWRDDIIPHEVEADYHALVKALCNLDRNAVSNHGWQPLRLVFDTQAHARWVEKHDALENLVQASQGDTKCLLLRCKATIARVALVYACIDHVLDPDAPQVIRVENVDKAAQLVDWVWRETQRVYSLIHAAPEQLNTQRLIEWLRAQGHPVTARDLLLSNRSVYQDTRRARLALDQLVAQNLGNWSDRPTTAKGGRPTAQFSLLSARNHETT